MRREQADGGAVAEEAQVAVVGDDVHGVGAPARGGGGGVVGAGADVVYRGDVGALFGG